MPVYVVSRYLPRRPGILAWEVYDEYRTLVDAQLAHAKLGTHARLDAIHEDGRSEPLDVNSRPLPPGQGGMPR